MPKFFLKRSKDIIKVLKGDEVDLEVLNEADNGEVADIKDQISIKLNDLIIPSHLNMIVREFSENDEELMQLYYEIFAELGQDGLKIVLTLDFLNIKNSNERILKQELRLLKDLFSKIVVSYQDFGVNPLVLLSSIVSKNPDISITQLIEITYKIERLITLSFPAKLHQKLMKIDWTINELVLLIENLEFIIKRDSRYAGFEYLRNYLNSANQVIEEGMLYN